LQPVQEPVQEQEQEQEEKSVQEQEPMQKQGAQVLVSRTCCWEQEGYPLVTLVQCSP
jgi:hypothetical protein